MTGIGDAHRRAVLRRAAVRATFAPSVHNTQPWRFVISHGELQIHADRRRQLAVLDPSGRQLTVSCGSALLNARVSIAADGFGAGVTRLPDRGQPDLLATVTLADYGPDDALAALDGAVERRQTNRRRFADDAVPAPVLTALGRAATAEGSLLLEITDDEKRRTVARLTRVADELENANPAYRAELRAWTADHLGRGDGVPQRAVAHVGAGAADELPLRDFDTTGNGYLPSDVHSTREQCLVLLSTPADQRVDWLRGGEALQRVLLQLTAAGLVAGPLGQATDLPTGRSELRTELGLAGYPLLLLRIGRAPLTPASRRRRLVDVLVEET